MDRMENIGTLQQTIDKIAGLLKEQQDVGQQTAEAGKNNLGKKPEEMKPEDRDKLNKAADAQQKLADKTAKELANMQKTGAVFRPGLCPENCAAVSISIPNDVTLTEIQPPA